ncbi:TetR family transcriptional regulator [Kribbella sp. GL6]|uniref:TetR/AcrR family transcriptional regulator n=1 Tax=Kribbella sp. GL6 TaxID=3419765 RepID=UPI003CFCCF36
MRSIGISDGSAQGAGQLTAVRIRDAAILRYGRDGFGVGLRAVAADAGVTAGLVVHHFGSKDGLRKACDDHVLTVIQSEKLKATTGGPAVALAQLAEIEEYAPMAMYSLRSLQAGGELAAAFVERMCRDAEEYLAVGVASGMVRPSRDPAARARYLAMQAMGTLLLWFSTRSGFGEVDDFRKELRALSNEVTLPALELYCQGLFADDTMLDAYLKDGGAAR